jgi:hypothetical protein
MAGRSTLAGLWTPASGVECGMCAEVWGISGQRSSVGLHFPKTHGGWKVQLARCALASASMNKATCSILGSFLQ